MIVHTLYCMKEKIKLMRCDTFNIAIDTLKSAGTHNGYRGHPNGVMLTPEGG